LVCLVFIVLYDFRIYCSVVMFICSVFCFVALAKARTRPSATLTRPTVSIEAATGTSATLTCPTVSTEIDDSTLLAEATKFEMAHLSCTFILI